ATGHRAVTRLDSQSVCQTSRHLRRLESGNTRAAGLVRLLKTDPNDTFSSLFDGAAASLRSSDMASRHRLGVRIPAGRSSHPGPAGFAAYLRPWRPGSGPQARL